MADILSTRPDLALIATQRVVEQWTARGAALVDSVDLRRWLNGLVQGLGRLKRSVLKFAQRTSAFGRAEKLFHLAEQAWEQFNGDYPRPDGEWASQEWEKRRGRRLAVLESAQPNWRQPGRQLPRSVGMTLRMKLSSAQRRWSSGARRFLRVLSSTSRAGLLNRSRPLLLRPSPPRCLCLRRNQHAGGRGPDRCQKPRKSGAFFLGLSAGDEGGDLSARSRWVPWGGGHCPFPCSSCASPAILRRTPAWSARCCDQRPLV